MRIKFYRDLFVSGRLAPQKGKIIENLKAGKILPFIYIIAVPDAGRNHLESFPALFLRRHIREGSQLFVAGLAAGYGDSLNMIRDIVNNVYKDTGGTDIKGYFLSRQKEYEESGG